MRGNNRHRGGGEFIYWYIVEHGDNINSLVIEIQGESVSRTDMNHIIRDITDIKDIKSNEGKDIFRVKSQVVSKIDNVVEDNPIFRIIFECLKIPLWKNIIQNYDKCDDYGKGLLREEMSKLDPNDFIKDMYELYCKVASDLMSFKPLSVFKETHPIIEEPIRLARVNVGITYSQRLAYHLAPLFLNSLSNDAGILCKFGVPEMRVLRDEHEDSGKKTIDELKSIVNAHGNRYIISDVVIENRNRYW